MVLRSDDLAQWRRTRGLDGPSGLGPSVVAVLNPQYLFQEHGYVYSGRCPASRPHVGHLVGWNEIRTYAQKSNSKVVFMVSDDQALHVKLAGQPQPKLFVEQNLLALRAFFGPELVLHLNSNETFEAELLFEAAELFRHTRQLQVLFGLVPGHSKPAALLYIFIQISLALKLSAQRPTTIFAAADQYPFFAKLKGRKNLSVVFVDMVPNLLGNDKMSGSVPRSAIFLTDDVATIQHKVWAARTDAGSREEHRLKGVGPRDVLLNFFTLMGYPCEEYRAGLTDVTTFKSWAATEIKYMLEPFR